MIFLFFSIVSSFEVIAENLVGQENVTRAVIIERNIGLAGAQVCNIITIVLIKNTEKNKNLMIYKQIDDGTEVWIYGRICGEWEE